MFQARVHSRARARITALGAAAALLGSLAASAVLAARPVAAATGDITEFSVPTASSGPQNMAVGSDGNLWFTEQNAGKIGQITPSGTITEFPIVGGSASQPNGIALGPDGNIWFTEFNAGIIGKITPSGVITQFPVLPAGASSGPRNIALGPDGNMWFTEYNANKIGVITPTGTVTEFSVVTATDTKPNPRGIIAGPDGNVWFTDYTGDSIGNINPTTDVLSTQVPVPTASSGPRSIDVGPDGNLWFTENNAAKVGRITTAGVITEFPTPTSGSIPARMTAGADGSMWFTENGASKIGQILPGSPNTITEYTIPTSSSAPVGIISGPDHNIWFAENGADKIGRVSVVLSTNTVLGSSLNPSLSGASVTFTATVTPSSATGNVTFMDGSSSLGIVPLSGGVAALSTSSLTVGSHSVTAVYAGDTFNTTSTSTAVVQVVQAVSNTGVGSSEEPSTSGDSVTFTATVTPSTATGLVTFSDGATSIGSGSLSGGTATFATSSLAPGDHSITAAYAGDTLDAASTSSPFSQHVNQITTSTGVASGNNPSQNGQPVTFTATVSPATATGSVTFFDGSTSLGGGTVSAGSASLTTSSLAVGTHSITATYNGDTDDAVSTSSVAVSQVVNPGNTTTVAGSSASPSTYGDSVTFTATVTPSTASGLVTFFDGATSLGTGTLSGGTTTFATSALGGGDHDITAVYGGDGSDDGSTSDILVQVVNPVTTGTLIGSGANPSTYGDSVTFTATVAPSTATGSVTFYDGATALGSPTLTSGTATLTTALLSGGDHDITATYNGDTNDAGSTSAQVVQVVNTVSSSTGVVSGTNPSQSGASVTFTASVSPSTATGSVTFYDGSTSLGSSPDNAGSATLSTAVLTVGTHSITAVYSGDTNDAGSTSSPISQVVQTISATALGSSANPSTFGESVTLTATVTPATASGGVTFFDGTTNLGTGTVVSGTATLSTSALAVGGHSLTAVYGGDAGDTTSTSTPVSQVVNQATTTALGTSSLNPSQSGQSVTFTVSVTPASATGTVTFKDGASSLATVRLTAGAATFTTSTLTVGSHSITASYSGDVDNLGATSPTLTQVVNNGGGGSQTALTSSANPAKAGTKITFTATVTPSSATGKVTFKDGNKTLGTAKLHNGVATFSTTTLSLGTHNITAVYAGNKKVPGSTSTVLAEKVQKKVHTVLTPPGATHGNSVAAQASSLLRRIEDRDV